MGKTLYGKYLDLVNNVGLNHHFCYVKKVWVSKNYPFNFHCFCRLPREVHVEVKSKNRTVKK